MHYPSLVPNPRRWSFDLSAIPTCNLCRAEWYDALFAALQRLADGKAKVTQPRSRLSVESLTVQGSPDAPAVIRAQRGATVELANVAIEGGIVGIRSEGADITVGEGVIIRRHPRA